MPSQENIYLSNKTHHINSVPEKTRNCLEKNQEQIKVLG